MKNILKGLVILLVMGFLTGTSLSVSLGGYVHTSPDNTLEGVTVQVVGGASTTTDANGLYNFTSGISNVTGYTVYAVTSGYYRTFASTTVTDDTELNITLDPPSYTVVDMDDIAIDLVGTGASEVKDDMPTIVDLGILYIIFLLLASVMGIMAVAILIIPKKLKPKHRL